MQIWFLIALCLLATGCATPQRVSSVPPQLQGAAQPQEGPGDAADALHILHTLIKPQHGEERWATISWKTDLTQARLQAAAEGKPILLWEMDGHPLGCT
ncbi:MAG: hypothetical protein FJZ47_06545 [Candidatus Tectomicrobia bacterium]|uniref:Lipoprotein n=1 Tax=Tectimicrobiota bacterium TaxID=2528274 RepID=A0A938B1T4_UNCTE|nr:hypothetical protein [Candidatus Tectomicrobia bacterium]